MNLQRILDKLDAQDERSAEFREEMLERLGAIETRIAVLETKESSNKDGWRTLGWIVTFLVSIAALVVSVTAKAQ